MQALALSEQNKEVIRADKLQKLHTLHNLAQLLKTGMKQGQEGARGGMQGVPAVPHTLRDSSLQAEAQSLRDGYLAESMAKLAVADRDYQDTLGAMNAAARSSVDPGELCLWQAAVMAIPRWTLRWLVCFHVESALLYVGMHGKVSVMIWHPVTPSFGHGRRANRAGLAGAGLNATC